MDMTLNIGHLITAATIIFVAGGFYYASRGESKQMKDDISDIKTDLKTLNKVVMDVALQNQRLDNQAERITGIEKRVDQGFASMERRWEEIRRGEGLVTEKHRA